MNTKAIYILVLFVIWSFISWYWYTCDIKGFCGAAMAERQAAQVILTEQEADERLCDPIIVDSLKLGWKNPEEQMKTLERFLNEEENEDLAVDGFFGRSDFAAVSRFQTKYNEDILEPYGRTSPTGFVHTETKDKINELYCASLGLRLRANDSSASSNSEEQLSF